MTRVTGPEGHPPGLEVQTNLAAQVDRVLLVPHVWGETKTWDPEGVLSTFPAIATALVGLLFGEWLLGRKDRSPFRTTLGLAARRTRAHGPGRRVGRVGAGLAAVPDQQGALEPVLRAAHGRARGGRAGSVLLRGGRRRHAPLGDALRQLRQERDRRLRGLGLLADTLSVVRWPAADGTVLSLGQRLYALFPASVLPPYEASFVWALMMVALFYLMAAFMDRRGIYLKV